LENWEAIHRWEWFRRSQWIESFRAGKLRLAGAIQEVLGANGMGDGLLLDCSCGLGFQSIVLAEAGVRVQGADRSPFAVERARELTSDCGLHIEYFASRWDELPQRTSMRFDAAFVDALSWLHSGDEMLAALSGLRGVLRPGGILIFLGEPEGVTCELREQRLESWWKSAPRASLKWTHGGGGLTCTLTSLGSRGPDYIDWHQIYLIEENKTLRLEHQAIRESLRWTWSDLTQAALGAGFTKLEMHRDAEWSDRGRPVGLNVAVNGSSASRS
jgi:SAM-dependent methyltransferase